MKIKKILKLLLITIIILIVYCYLNSDKLILESNLYSITKVDYSESFNLVLDTSKYKGLTGDIKTDILISKQFDSSLMLNKLVVSPESVAIYVDINNTWNLFSGKVILPFEVNEIGCTFENINFTLTDLKGNQLPYQLSSMYHKGFIIVLDNHTFFESTNIVLNFILDNCIEYKLSSYVKGRFNIYINP